MSDMLELGIVGMGPAGFGVAMGLQGTPTIKNTICFERGQTIGVDHCSVLSNEDCCQATACHVVSGIGGASNLSSGKISNFPAGSGLLRFFSSEQQLRDMMSSIISILEIDASLKKIDIDKDTISRAEEHYRKNGIQYKYYDVYEFESEKYRRYLSTTFEILKNEGLQVLVSSEVISINRDPAALCFEVTTRHEGVLKKYYIQKVVLATGAIEVHENLISSLVKEQNISFEIGIRVEAESETFGHSLNTHGDLKLRNGAGRTYCVTKNGTIISYHTDGLNFLEGYIDSSKRTGYSNLAILIKSDDEKALSNFLSIYREKYGGIPVKQKYIDYLNCEKSSGEVYASHPNARCGNISTLFPEDINKSIRNFLSNVLIGAMSIDGNKLTLVAPELKILRNVKLSNNFELIPQLFVVGAATGEFRGILQSICSGIRCGHYLVRR